MARRIMVIIHGQVQVFYLVIQIINRLNMNRFVEKQEKITIGKWFMASQPPLNCFGFIIFVLQLNW